MRLSVPALSPIAAVDFHNKHDIIEGIDVTTEAGAGHTQLHAGWLGTLGERIATVINKITGPIEPAAPKLTDGPGTTIAIPGGDMPRTTGSNVRRQDRANIFKRQVISGPLNVAPNMHGALGGISFDMANPEVTGAGTLAVSSLPVVLSSNHRIKSSLFEGGDGPAPRTPGWTKGNFIELVSTVVTNILDISYSGQAEIGMLGGVGYVPVTNTEKDNDEDDFGKLSARFGDPQLTAKDNAQERLKLRNRMSWDFANGKHQKELLAAKQALGLESEKKFYTGSKAKKGVDLGGAYWKYTMEVLRDYNAATAAEKIKDWLASDYAPPVVSGTWGATQAELYRLQNPCKYTIIGVAADGTRTTIHCNPGPCTMGSVLRHVRISGLPPMVPLTLYNAVIERMAGTLTASESPDEAFALASKLMQTSEVRATDGNAESAYRVPAYTTILAEVSRRREAYEYNDGKVIDGVLIDVTVEYERPETTTKVTTSVDGAETEELRKKREDRAEADRLTQAFEQRLATNIARDAERRAANPGLEVVTPVVTQPTMPTW